MSLQKDKDRKAGRADEKKDRKSDSRSAKVKDDGHTPYQHVSASSHIEAPHSWEPSGPAFLDDTVLESDLKDGGSLHKSRKPSSSRNIPNPQNFRSSTTGYVAHVAHPLYTHSGPSLPFDYEQNISSHSSQKEGKETKHHTKKAEGRTADQLIMDASTHLPSRPWDTGRPAYQQDDNFKSGEDVVLPHIKTEPRDSKKKTSSSHDFPGYPQLGSPTHYSRPDKYTSGPIFSQKDKGKERERDPVYPQKGDRRPEREIGASETPDRLLKHSGTKHEQDDNLDFRNTLSNVVSKLGYNKKSASQHASSSSATESLSSGSQPVVSHLQSSAHGHYTAQHTPGAVGHSNLLDPNTKVLAGSTESYQQHSMVMPFLQASNMNSNNIHRSSISNANNDYSQNTYKSPISNANNDYSQNTTYHIKNKIFYGQAGLQGHQVAHRQSYSAAQLALTGRPDRTASDSLNQSNDTAPRAPEPNPTNPQAPQWPGPVNAQYGSTTLEEISPMNAGPSRSSKRSDMSSATVIGVFLKDFERKWIPRGPGRGSTHRHIPKFLQTPMARFNSSRDIALWEPPLGFDVSVHHNLRPKTCIELGDLGVFTESGGFASLWNMFYSLEDNVKRSGFPPNGFSPFPYPMPKPTRQQIPTGQYYHDRKFMLENNKAIDGVFHFAMANKHHGASAIGITSGGIRVFFREYDFTTSQMRDYLVSQVDIWKGHVERSHPGMKLALVTGLYLVRGWGSVTFHEPNRLKPPVDAWLSPSSQHHTQYDWTDNSGSKLQTGLGPQPEDSITDQHPSENTPNNCIAVTAYAVSRGKKSILHSLSPSSSFRGSLPSNA